MARSGLGPVMKGYPLVPGVLDAGHDAAGLWHPGAQADCPQCRPAPLPPVVVEVTVKVATPKPSTITLRHRGSDCLTGKKQFATRKDAMAEAVAIRRGRRHFTLHPFKCSWCLCYHNGNADRKDASKNRSRR